MCTVVLSLRPDSGVPLLLLGVRDELTGRPWRPPARHWESSPLIGGIDEQAGGTWLAVHPGDPLDPGEMKMACLLNGRGLLAAPDGRRSRGELPLRAAADGAGALKELAGDPRALAAYDPFHLVYGDIASVTLLSWDGSVAALTDLPPGTHLLTNAGHSYAAPVLAAPGAAASGPVTDPKAAHFGPKFAAALPSGDPALLLAAAWEPWLTLADGDGLPPGDPRAIVARRTLPDGREWGTTSQTLVALAPGAARYDFRPVPGEWYQVPVRTIS